MKVTLLRPNMGLSRGTPYEDKGRMEPLTLAILAGQLPPQVEVACYDDRCERIRFDEPTDLAAITVETYMAQRAYEIAAEYRRRGVPVLLGGYHPTLVPEEAMEHGDAVLTGQAEGLLPAVLEDLAAGRLQRRYEGTLRPDLQGVRVRHEIFKDKHYLPIALTQFSRGCVNQCNYCATGTIFQQRHLWRPVDEMVEEIRARGTRLVFFVDDNIVGNHAIAKELFQALIPLKIRWVSQASLDFAADDELLDLMIRSGCQGLVVGFESLSPENLAQMQKNCNQRDRYEPLLEKIRAKGLMLWAAFLLGYDADTPESIRATCDWALSHRFAFAAFNILTPYPGTPLYAKMQEDGRLIYDRWWLDPRYRFGDAVFQPAHMQPEALSRACLDARIRFNSLPSLVRRASDFKTNAKNLWSLGTFMNYGSLFRQEMLAKIRMQLGYHRA